MIITALLLKKNVFIQPFANDEYVIYYQHYDYNTPFLCNYSDGNTNFAAFILNNSSLIGMVRKWSGTQSDVSQIYLVTENNWKDNN